MERTSTDLTRYFLGWDVGAWNCDSIKKRKGKDPSRDALCCLSDGPDYLPVVVGKPQWCNLRETLVTCVRAELLKAMFSLCGVSLEMPADVTMAIDTPLGWPLPMLNLLGGGSPCPVPVAADQNPYLFRQTELRLFEKGKRPLSTVRDMIGSQSTKGIHFLRTVGAKVQETGVWKAALNKEFHLTIIETYPALCYTSTSLSTRLAGMSLDPFAGKGSGDKLDSLWCSLVAWAFQDNPHLLDAPADDIAQAEGWIWSPNDCTSDKLANHDADDGEDA